MVLVLAKVVPINKSQGISISFIRHAQTDSALLATLAQGQSLRYSTVGYEHSLIAHGLLCFGSTLR